MSFSIVTISFNQKQFLERAIHSVLSQSYHPVQYIIIDAGSTDGSREVLERYRCDVACLIIEPDSGPAGGLNKGLSRATGQFFGYLNADDEMLPGALVEAAAHLTSRPGTSAVTGDGLIVDGDGRLQRRVRSTPVGRWKFAFGASVVLQQATFFRTAAVRSVGGFNVANRTCWDAELIVELLAAGNRIDHVHRDWGVFRHHPTSISVSGRFADVYQRDQDRLTARLTGRPGHPADPLRRAAARTFKYLRDPLAALMRVSDTLTRRTG